MSKEAEEKKDQSERECWAQHIAPKNRYARETEAARKRKLEDAAQRARLRLAKETEEGRAIRLEKDRVRYKKFMTEKLPHETDQDREKRLRALRDKQSRMMRIKNSMETEEQREKHIKISLQRIQEEITSHDRKREKKIEKDDSPTVIQIL